ncbi:hypothetical protein N0V93_009956 [Gnomoniopsis smithogilvyi]|uniref:Uncharacterized protein n=1 Tax=Gnomoniopsis smithogilvyi TaxID=1191159 RepID=A0A9W9CSY8_9PEZI|nr:hypothetical protein N0V93_009956 [Gnomoniopsis smithogilvyi]
MGKPLPTLNSAQLLELGYPHLTYTFDEGEHIRCDRVFTYNRFKLQIHFEHIPPLHECANLANIRCQASLIGTDGFAICLGDCNGVYSIDAFRELDIDERDMTMHCIEPIVTYALPEFKDVVRLKGKYKVRFEVIWIVKKGCMKEKRVIHTVDTPAIELWHEVKTGKPEPGAPGSIIRPSWKKR